MEVNKIIQGDTLEILKTLPSEFVDCVITSPPYWALRDYGIEGQLGLETTFQEYITKLCDIFDEVKRVLKKTGTCWINLGDTYAGSGNGSNDYRTEKSKSLNGIGKYADKKYQGLGSSKLTAKNRHHEEHRFERRGKTNEIAAKSLCQIPSRFAIEMSNRGWIIRNEIIWHKPNCMPQSVKDRFTVDFEKIYFFVKNRKYWFEQQYEPHIWADKDKRSQRHWSENKAKSGKMIEQRYSMGQVSYGVKGRNKRTVWRIPTVPYKDAHFATFPQDLIVPMIKAGCPEGGVVLDPFIGSGTTAVVAQKLGRKYLGIELNPEYIKMAEKRLLQERLL